MLSGTHLVRCCLNVPSGCLAHRAASAVSYPPKQIRNAKRRLEMHKNLLKTYGARTVDIPKSGGGIVVLFPSCHVEDASVIAVQKLIQSLKPDVVCPELCKERLQGLTDLRMQAFEGSLPKDLIARVGRHQHMDGLDMTAAVLEADRHKIDMKPVDRLHSVTTARVQAAASRDAFFAARAPSLFISWEANRRMLINFFHVRTDAKGEVFLPKELARDIMHLLQLPWKYREGVLIEGMLSGGMISWDTLTYSFSAYREEQKVIHGKNLRDLKASIQELDRQPMPPRLEKELGPETLPDILARVVSKERDIVIANRLRELVSGGRHGPLAFAPLGAAHVPGVASFLRMPKQDLVGLATLLESKPDVPWWKSIFLPMEKVMFFMQCMLSMPRVPRGRGRGSYEFA